MKLYRMNNKTGRFEYYQAISQSASSLRFSKIKKTEYVLYASPETGFGLCPSFGVSGFQDCYTVPSANIKHVETVTTDEGLFVILGKEDRIAIHRVVSRGDTAKYDKDVC